jgi:hypothetical protein
LIVYHEARGGKRKKELYRPLLENIVPYGITEDPAASAATAACLACANNYIDQYSASDRAAIKYISRIESSHFGIFHLGMKYHNASIPIIIDR